MVILARVRGSVGIHRPVIALIMGVDRLLDRSRTAINVAGDLVAGKLMERLAGRNSHGARGKKPAGRRPGR